MPRTWPTSKPRRAALADPGPSIPLEQVLAEYADDLAAFPDER